MSSNVCASTVGYNIKSMQPAINEYTNQLLIKMLHPICLFANYLYQHFYYQYE